MAFSCLFIIALATFSDIYIRSLIFLIMDMPHSLIVPFYLRECLYFTILRDVRTFAFIAQKCSLYIFENPCRPAHYQKHYLFSKKKNKKGITKSSNFKNRSRRSFRENFILPGTKWCGAGQLAEDYGELGLDRTEDKCCRAHDNCRMNIGQFRRRFGYFNFRPYTISHCRCDRRLVFILFF